MWQNSPGLGAAVGAEAEVVVTKTSSLEDVRRSAERPQGTRNIVAASVSTIFHDADSCSCYVL